jgi:hypothetical protein
MQIKIEHFSLFFVGFVLGLLVLYFSVGQLNLIAAARVGGRVDVLQALAPQCMDQANQALQRQQVQQPAPQGKH